MLQTKQTYKLNITDVSVNLYDRHQEKKIIIKLHWFLNLNKQSLIVWNLKSFLGSPSSFASTSHKSSVCNGGIYLIKTVFI